MEIYPWLQSDFERLTERLEDLHHGLMLTGLVGIGKQAFAIILAQKLLCQEKDTEGMTPCRNCQSCRLFSAGTHPDFHLLTSEHQVVESENDLMAAYSARYQDTAAREKRASPSRVIPIDQVRSLIQRFTTRSHISSHKVAVITPAEGMNISSSNALLKLLEEPPEDSTLILVSTQPGYLPATIRSRCMNIKLNAPDTEQQKQWLMDFMPQNESEMMMSLIPDGPLAVLKYYQQDYLDQHQQMLKGVSAIAMQQVNGIEVAAKFSKQEFRTTLLWLQNFVSDLIKWRSGAKIPSWTGQTNLKIEGISMQSLFFLYDKIGFYKKIAREQLNEQLALEDLMLIFQRVLAR